MIEDKELKEEDLDNICEECKKLDKIIKEIEKNTHCKLTLGGCIIEKVNQTVIISKES